MSEAVFFTEKKRYAPATCPACGKRDLYLAETYGMADDIVWLCRHCGEGWIDLAATWRVGNGRAAQHRRPVNKKAKPAAHAFTGRSAPRA